MTTLWLEHEDLFEYEDIWEYLADNGFPHAVAFRTGSDMPGDDDIPWDDPFLEREWIRSTTEPYCFDGEFSPN